MISNVQKTVLKSTAKAVFQLKDKQKDLLASMAQLEAEVREIDELINQYNDSISAITGGFKAKDIMQAVDKETARRNKEGEIITMKTYEWLYPDTIIPKRDIETIEDVEDTSTRKSAFI